MPSPAPITKARKKKPKYKYPVVVVVWDDALSDPNWFDEPVEALKPTIVTTVGYLIRDIAGEDRILVADSYIDDAHNTISNSVVIPRGMIQSTTYLIKDGWKKT